LITLAYAAGAGDAMVQTEHGTKDLASGERSETGRSAADHAQW
jgi:hypothetical protein